MVLIILFKTMASVYTQQSKNVRKTWFLVVLFAGLISLIFYIFGAVYNQPALAFVGLAISLSQAIIGYYAGGSMAIASAGGAEVTEAQAPQIHIMVENLSRIAGIPKPKIFISPDPSANAFACGRDPKNANICFNQGILNILDKNELEAVTAHEISHIKNRDILLQTMVMVMAGIISFVADQGLRMTLWGGGNNNSDSDDSNKSPIWAIVYIAVIVLAPIVSTLITFAVSRQREYLADATAVTLTRYPNALISALQKLYNNPIASEHISSATSHFYIAPPKAQFGQQISGLFSTHPKIEDRVKALKEM